MARPKTYRRQIVIFILALLLIGLIGFVGLFSFSVVDMNRSIEEVSAAALKETGLSGGERVEALMVYVKEGDAPWRDKDRAVWALGYLRDRSALPFLEGLRNETGECDHDSGLCQKEIGKAIKKINKDYPVIRLMDWLRRRRAESAPGANGA